VSITEKKEGRRESKDRRRGGKAELLPTYWGRKKEIPLSRKPSLKKKEKVVIGVREKNHYSSGRAKKGRWCLSLRAARRKGRTLEGGRFLYEPSKWSTFAA